MKRFYAEARLLETDAGFGVALDGRAVRSPARRPFLTPSRALAEACAAEWEAQAEDIDPRTMPMTGYANRAIDLDAPDLAMLRDQIAGFAETDLLRHRAEAADLAEAQAAAWDPWLRWAQTALDLRLTPTAGLAPERDPSVTAVATRHVAHAPAFAAPALHRVCGVLGSFVLAFALRGKAASADALFAISRVDEEHQIKRWGRDAEAEARAAAQLAELKAAARFMGLAED